MNVIFENRTTVMISANGYPADYITIPKQEIADYLLGKYDKGRLLYNGTPINERALLMSYLPFTISIGVKVTPPGENVEGNYILLKVESGTFSTPLTIYMEVSDELMAFLRKKYDER